MKIKKPIVISGLIFLLFGAALGLSTLNENRLESSAEKWKATLFILPKEGTFALDEDFQATVNVDTNMEINAASGEIYFPVDELEVIDLSKEESIFSLWVIEPSYSNIDGTIQFVGVLPTPGFKGKEGKILTITFKAKKEGKAEIKFEEGLVLANDGRGTDILKERKGASYELISPIPSDLNSDGDINLADLSILLSNWGIPENPQADINKDSKVDIADFSIFFFYLGQ